MENPFLAHVMETQGLQAAYDAACKLLRDHEADQDALWRSRFFELRSLDDNTKKLWPTTERAVSNAFDQANLSDEPLPTFYFCAADGRLHEVSLQSGRPHGSDCDEGFVIGHSALIANGEVVGRVEWTDH